MEKNKEDGNESSPFQPIKLFPLDASITDIDFAPITWVSIKDIEEDGMTDLEIIKQEVDFLDKYMADHELDERFEAILTHATRMAAEIERLKKNVEFIYINETEKQFVETLSDNDKKELIENLLCANLTKALANEKLRNEKALLQIALAEKPDIVRCGECKKRETENCPRYHYDEVYMTHFWPDDKSYCEKGTHKEAKNED